MTEMVERVARAIAARSPEFECTEDQWPNAVDLARAAIAAMREPTDEMIKVVRLKMDGWQSYPIMIDTALKD